MQTISGFIQAMKQNLQVPKSAESIVSLDYILEDALNCDIVKLLVVATLKSQHANDLLSQPAWFPDRFASNVGFSDRHSIISIPSCYSLGQLREALLAFGHSPQLVCIERSCLTRSTDQKRRKPFAIPFCSCMDFSVLSRTTGVLASM